MSLSKTARRIARRATYVANSKPSFSQHFINTIKVISPAASEHTTEHHWKNIPYSIERTTFPSGRDSISTKVHGIAIPDYPENTTSGLLTSDLFTKMMLGYGNSSLFLHGKDVTFHYDVWKKYPSYNAEDVKEAFAKAQSTIDAYTDHRESLEKLFDAVWRAYPENKEERNQLIRDLELPMGIHIYKRPHPFQHSTFAERTKIFEPKETSLNWFVGLAYVVLENPACIEKYYAEKKYPDVNRSEYETQLIRNLHYFEDIGRAVIDWDRIHKAFPEGQGLTARVEDYTELDEYGGNNKLFIPYAYRYLEGDTSQYEGR